MIERIVVINDLSRPQGGASLLAVRSARAFAQRGYAVTMISGDAGPAEPIEGVSYILLGQERLLAAASAAAMLRGIYNDAARKLVGDWIARNDTQQTVYHIHGWSQILSPALFGALNGVRERTIMTAHDFFLTCPNGAMFDYGAAKPCNRRPMSGSCLGAGCDRRKRSHKLWRVARHAVQGRLLAQGELPPQLLIHAGMKAYFERSGLGERDMAVLPNPVVPYCRERVQAEANRDVLFVGRMEETKGIDLAAEACRRAGVRLVAVGDGALLDTLRADYPEMHFPGRLASQDIGALAEQARMLVMPSRHSEPFGLTAVEALWSGLPVLSSEHALIADSIRQAGAGLSIDPLDLDGFADAIRRLTRDDALTRRMSLAAFERTGHLALEPDAWIEALLAAYRALLAGGRTELARAAAAWTAAAAAPRPSARVPAGVHS